ncbi:2-keto-4-pentenoate hydratase [Ramlibacter albus]|uniref:Fumarylacetoacetate hydrolase family protein n=1 Tax=Ramlibacter albus TaxID=2079448 RepID=A0A923M7D7_9BURK|nr:fumarylacetoacetate hydrolase family protein [Ramlibacter albus]MBC5765612.1 fumarylacetoacetate hydrolase family protein [Ramlibacter albus]
MSEPTPAELNARRMWDARVARQPYANLPDSGTPLSIEEAYAAQEAYWRLAEPVYGPVAGVKVATTTKVMQQLMGITHPCGGAIFAKTVHASPARISKGSFVNMRVESEIALNLGTDMPAARAPWTAETAAQCVAGAMPAFELIEDRNAVYKETRATSMIVDNCWNGGVVLGPMKKVAPGDVIGVKGRQTLNGQPSGEGNAENPYATLAWLANLMASRKLDLKSGMVVITGSVVPTFSVSPGDRVVFTVEGLGEAVLDVT